MNFDKKTCNDKNELLKYMKCLQKDCQTILHHGQDMDGPGAGNKLKYMGLFINQKNKIYYCI